MNKVLKAAGVIVILAVILILIIFGVKGLGAGGLFFDARSIESLIKDGKLDEAKIKLDEIADKRPDTKAGKLYFQLARSYEDKKETLKARDAYQVILRKYPNVDNVQEVQDRIGPLNIAIIFSNIVTDKDALYEVQPGDTLLNIAKKFGTTIELIKAENSLRSSMIKARSKLKVSKARYKILVDKSQNLLTLLADNDLVKVYRVSTGKDNCTPVGNFKIVNKMVDPVWYTEGAIVPAESPDNILGSRWLGLSVPGYGIHGTMQPDKIGEQVTQGCVRMLNKEVEELYVIVPVGTEVTITD